MLWKKLKSSTNSIQSKWSPGDFFWNFNIWSVVSKVPLVLMKIWLMVLPMEVQRGNPMTMFLAIFESSLTIIRSVIKASKRLWKRMLKCKWNLTSTELLWSTKKMVIFFREIAMFLKKF